MADVEVRFIGGLFEPSADGIVADMLDAVRHTVSGQASAEVHDVLDRNIEHPTPYYETQISVTNPAPDIDIVTDRHVIYGPWLEGVGRRNATTRFKGYHAFRTAYQKVNRGAVGRTVAIIADAMRRLK